MQGPECEIYNGKTVSEASERVKKRNTSQRRGRLLEKRVLEGGGAPRFFTGC